MNGGGIQKCYEHMVEPEGVRIAATARLIDSEQNAREPSGFARK